MLMTVCLAASFFALILLAALFVLTLSGHFPLEASAPVLASAVGYGLTLATAVGTLITFVWGLFSAVQKLEWFILVLIGGLAMLIAPQGLAWFDDEFLDGRAGLVVFAIATAGAAFALHAL